MSCQWRIMVSRMLVDGISVSYLVRLILSDWRLL